jgi:hypothetical protein
LRKEIVSIWTKVAEVALWGVAIWLIPTIMTLGMVWLRIVSKRVHP